MAMLGKMLIQAEASPADLAGGIDLLTRAADLNNAEALYQLGNLFLRGRAGVARDAEKARAYLERAISLGHGYAAVRLGQALIDGNELPADVSGGLDILTRGAEAGNAEALNRLGQVYRMGASGIPRDEKKALDLFERAAAAGSASALMPLADMHLNGEGTVASGAEAIEYYRQASAAGMKRAVVRMSDVYLWGKSGVEKNAEQAAALLQQAADAGNTDALLELLSYYQNGRPGRIKKNLEVARTLLRRYMDSVDETTAATAELIFEAAQNAGDASLYPKLANHIGQLPKGPRIGALLRLRAANKSAAIYVAQDRLANAGLYHGAVDGMPSPDTLNAFQLACGDGGRCGSAPLDWQAFRYIAENY